MDADGVAVAPVRRNRDPCGFAAAYRQPSAASEAAARLVATLLVTPASSGWRPQDRTERASASARLVSIRVLIRRDQFSFAGLSDEPCRISENWRFRPLPAGRSGAGQLF